MTPIENIQVSRRTALRFLLGIAGAALVPGCAPAKPDCPDSPMLKAKDFRVTATAAKIQSRQLGATATAALQARKEGESQKADDMSVKLEEEGLVAAENASALQSYSGCKK